MLFIFKRNQQNLVIRINNNFIDEKTVTSFLGVQIDNKLNWKPHIDHICYKVSKATAILRFVRYYYPKNILEPCLEMTALHHWVALRRILSPALLTVS